MVGSTSLETVVAWGTDAIPESAKKTEEPAEELPEVDEATVGQLSEEVSFANRFN
jgi:hypothetical protein